MSERSRQGELERRLGLREATTIGLGTMIGAGIFVFPGIAAGRAGAGAILSFVLGAVIALLVAIPTSELATAMPHSGGGYYYVSRSLGTFAGVVVGVGQWIGLMFASAFYLVGFGHYLDDLLAELGAPFGVGVEPLAIAASVLLTAIAITGAEKTGNLQTNMVGVLVVVFSIFIGWGILDAIGVVGSTTLPAEFLPFGTRPVLSTAALVFTSYLGFAQIATVAGDIRDPGRNLPRAMLGSVVAVGVLYALMIFVSTTTFDASTLGSFGETAAIEVARRLLGTAGAILITGAGLLATLSSANASIMSASRSVFALSRDGVVPEAFAVVNRRFGTPHVAVLVAGVPVAGLVLTGRTEILAEVASLLHLVMYGLICAALIVLRRRSPHWYRPVFTTPAYPVVPVLGGLASLGIIAFMSSLALAIGGGLVVLVAGWYLLYARDVRFGEGSREEVLLPSLAHAQVLVPVVLPDPDPLPGPLGRLLAGLDLLVVGLYAVPKQTAVEQARDEFGEEAEDEFRRWCEPLERGSGSMETRLVFTQEPLETIERIGAEEYPDAILVPRPIGEEDIGQILAAVRSEANAERIAQFVAAIAAAADAGVLVVHAAGPHDGQGDRNAVVDRFRRLLIDEGVDEGRIESDIVDDDDPAGVIIEEAKRYHLVVVGESEPDDPEVVFGDLTRRVAREIERPVLVARAERDPPSPTDSEA